MILKRGRLTKGKQKALYEIRLAVPTDIDKIMALQEQVYEALSNKAVLATDSKETLAEAINGMGAILCVFINESQLIAYRYIRFPGSAPDNLGLEIGLDESVLNQVVHLETTVVSPEYRGNHLQSITFSVVEAYLESWGYRHILCTVSPENPHSLKNIMEAGLEIKALKRMYKSDSNPFGLWRFILYKDLKDTRMMDPIEEFGASFDYFQ
jgi:hypothetical protein